MPLQIAPFGDEHLEQAVGLLAARHRADRAHFPELPERFEGIEAARGEIEAQRAMPGAWGVAALRGGSLAGYLIGATVMPTPGSTMSGFIAPRSLSIGPAGHATDGADPFQTYRELYAALAPHWIERGCFDHYVTVAESDTEAMAAWFSLAFGRELMGGVRNVDPVAGARTAGIEVHRAGAEDVEVVFDLVQGLYHHHAASPIFLPLPPENEPANREHTLESLQDPACAVFVAYRDGRPVALEDFTPPRGAGRLTPDRAIYLLHGYTVPEERGGGTGTTVLAQALDWVREAGHECITINWFAANVLADRFWRRSGFRPMNCRLYRRIDARIAWAH